MHSHSLPAAIGVARNGDFQGVRRLLDVAGGSGCFSIALALRHFSNVFHDWDAPRREELAARSFAALPSGGRIYLHEMLLNDTSDGPLAPALFSVMMLGTRGKQFSAPELNVLLTGAGFVGTSVTHTYSYHSLVSASKPA
jgi:hypothetical protein